MKASELLKSCGNISYLCMMLLSDRQRLEHFGFRNKYIIDEDDTGDVCVQYFEAIPHPYPPQYNTYPHPYALATRAQLRKS